jgi:hypothetical protein
LSLFNWYPYRCEDCSTRVLGWGATELPADEPRLTFEQTVGIALVEPSEAHSSVAKTHASESP